MTPTEDLGALAGRGVRANVLHEGSCVTSVNGYGRWVATYDFTLTGRSAVQIDLENISDLDPYLRLLDASGAEVASDDDGGDNLNARIRQTLDRGTYRIEATKYNSGAGTYRLTVVVEGGASGNASGGSTAIRSLDAGAHYTCAVTGAGDVQCWGQNDDGQTNAPQGDLFTQVSAGTSHVCAITERGNLRCWGQTVLGDPVAQGGEFTHVNASAHTCAVTTGGQTHCWGWNHRGQTNVPNGRFTQVSGGGWHTCGLRSDGVVQCWGGNENGQASAPAGRFMQVSSGAWFTCGVTTGNAVRCWGGNDEGQTNAPSGRFTQVTAGALHACALTADGEVRCWGWNDSGQANPPVGRFTSVTAGTYHTCAVSTDGAVKCWGSNAEGQLDVPNDLAAMVACPEPPLIASGNRGVELSGQLDRGDCLSAYHPNERADVYRFTVISRMLVDVQVVFEQLVSPRTYLSKVNPATQTTEQVSVDLLSRVASSIHFEQWLDPGLYELEVTKEVADRDVAVYDLSVSPVMVPLAADFAYEIASLYAPVLHFAEGEKYFPTSVETMLARSDLKQGTDGTEVTLARRGSLSLDDLTRWNGRGTYLDLDDTDEQREAAGPEVVYTVVADIDDGTASGAVVQYWFFYLYNETLPDGFVGAGLLGAHEGDWEGIQLFFENRRAIDLLFADATEAPPPDTVGFASHNGGFVGLRVDRTQDDTGECGAQSVYVARNRHASYPQAGAGKLSGEGEVILTAPQGFPTNPRSTLGIANGGLDNEDHYWGDGESWSHSYAAGRERYELRIMPIHATSWVWWDGKWGESGGPHGPAFKLHFRNSPMLNFFASQWWLASFSCRGGWTTYPVTD